MKKATFFLTIFLSFAPLAVRAATPCTDMNDCQVKLLQERNDNIKLQVQLAQYQAKDMVQENNAAIKKLQDEQKKEQEKPPVKQK